MEVENRAVAVVTVVEAMEEEGRRVAGLTEELAVVMTAVEEEREVVELWVEEVVRAVAVNVE
jgi:hypothetical protein